MRVLPVAIALTLLAQNGVWADWKVSQDKSSLAFTAYSRMHNVDGEFRNWEFQGKIPDSWNGNGEVVIQTASVETGREKRDRHLRNQDFFHTSQFATARYKILRMEEKGEQIVVRGEFTLLGRTQPLSVTLRKKEQGNRALLTGETVINRSKFGMNYNSSMNPIEDRVTLRFRLALTKE